MNEVQATAIRLRIVADNDLIKKYNGLSDDIKLAVKALEKQIPKKPIHDGLYVCPNCYTIMLQGAFEARGKCCKECGQVLDWGENPKD